MHVLVSFLKIKNVWATVYFECAYINKREWLFHRNTDTKAKNVIFWAKYVLMLKIMTFTNHHNPSTLHPQKWATDLLFKNNEICKHLTYFKTSPPPLCVGVINVWFLVESIF